MGPYVNSGVTHALQMCADDKSINVVIFTGAGEKAFSAGGNLDGGGASAGMRQTASADKPPPTVSGAVANLRHGMSSSQLLRNSHFVSIAAINGACAGAGMSWALACDLRIGAENTLIRAGFLTAGLSGDYGGTVGLICSLNPNTTAIKHVLTFHSLIRSSSISSSSLSSLDNT